MESGFFILCLQLPMDTRRKIRKLTGKTFENDSSICRTLSQTKNCAKGIRRGVFQKKKLVSPCASVPLQLRLFARIYPLKSAIHISRQRSTAGLFFIGKRSIFHNQPIVHAPRKVTFRMNLHNAAYNKWCLWSETGRLQMFDMLIRD